MPKNNKLINQYKAFYQRVHTDVEQIYSSLAIDLFNKLDYPTDEEKQDAIAEVFAESQRIWTECANEHKNMIQLCEELTGIDVRKPI